MNNKLNNGLIAGALGAALALASLASPAFAQHGGGGGMPGGGMGGGMRGGMGGGISAAGWRAECIAREAGRISHAAVELQGSRPEHPSARADLLPDIPVPLVSHQAICSERTAVCAVIQALRALPPDIALCIIRDLRIMWLSRIT